MDTSCSSGLLAHIGLCFSVSDTGGGPRAWALMCLDVHSTGPTRRRHSRVFVEHMQAPWPCLPASLPQQLWRVEWPWGWGGQPVPFVGLLSGRGSAGPPAACMTTPPLPEQCPHSTANSRWRRQGETKLGLCCFALFIRRGEVKISRIG